MTLAPAITSAEIIRGGAHAAGPLDLSKAKVGQHTLHLLATLETSRPLPRLQLLGAHPTLEESKAERYLCLNLASPARRSPSFADRRPVRTPQETRSP